MGPPPQPYPLTAKPETGESLRGYMHRLALRNGFPYFNWIMTDLRISQISTALREGQLEQLSILSGAPVQELRCRQESKVGRFHFFQGQRVGTPMVERQASRLCPACLRIQRIHKIIWDFMPISVCPLHGCPLTRNCPTCNTALHWRRNDLYRCPKGHDLLGQKLGQHADADAARLTGVRAICEHVGLHEGWQPVLIDLPLSIKQLPVRDFVHLLALLGRIAVDSDPARTKPSRDGASPELHLVLARGYRLARDWPNSLRDLLDGLTARSGDPNLLAKGTHPERKFLHGALARRKSPLAALVGREIWSYAREKRVGLNPGAFGFTPPDFDKTYVASTDARKMMGISLEAVYRIARDEGWHGADQVGDGKSIWLLRAEVDAWCQSHRGRIAEKHVARRLHVSPDVIFDMAQRGLFGQDARQRKCHSARNRWWALPKEVDIFLERLRASIRAVPLRDGDRCVSRMGLTKQAATRQISLGAVLEGILAGSIRAVELTAEDLSSLKFSLGDAVAYEGVLPRPAGEAPGVCHSLTSAGKLHRLGFHHLSRAVDLGLIETEEPRRAGRRLRIREDAIERFLERYTTIGLLARRFKLSPASLRHALKRSGIAPYGQAANSHDTAQFYAWDAIRSFGTQKLLRGVRKDEGRWERAGYSQGRSRHEKSLEAAWRQLAP